MSIQVGDQVSDLTIQVVEGPSLLGRDMRAKFTLPWQNIFSVTPTTAADIIQQYPELFDNSTVGKLKGVQVSLRVKDDNPVFVKPRVVPFAIRKKYEEALEKLVAEDIIKKVEHSEWASPTVSVIKPNADMRICGDYSVTINQHSNLEQYPVPTLEDLLSKLSGGQKYTKLDLSQAYHQLELTPESRKYTTINTHHGLYQYKRLVYGVNSAVSIFQRTIESVLKGLPGCCVRIDDILVTGETDEIHLENLHRVFQRLQECGLKLKREKFHFMLGQVVYLGMTFPELEFPLHRRKYKPSRMQHHRSMFLNFSHLLVLLTFYISSYLVLPKFCFPCISYYAREHRGNGESPSKMLLRTLNLRCVRIQYCNITTLRQNWSFSVMHHLLEWGQSYFSPEQMVH